MANIIMAENFVEIDRIPVDSITSTIKDDPRNWNIDLRHGVISRNNTCDLDMYMNYIKLLKVIADDNKAAKIRYMLDLGFMPVVMPPILEVMDILDSGRSYFRKIDENLLYESIRKPILDKLNANGIQSISRIATSFTNQEITSDYPDIWVSKLECEKVTGIDAPYNTVAGLLEVIM